MGGMRMRESRGIRRRLGGSRSVSGVNKAVSWLMVDGEREGQE